jgi:hypothetical protein
MQHFVDWLHDQTDTAHNFVYLNMFLCAMKLSLYLFLILIYQSPYNIYFFQVFKRKASCSLTIK